MSVHVLGQNVEFSAETQHALEILDSREPKGNAAELTAVGTQWWGGDPQLPLGELYPHHEEAVLENRFMRWLRLTGWIARHPAEIGNRVGLTAVTWVIPPASAVLSNYIHCCVTQITQQGVIQGRAYKFWVSLAPELRPSGGKQPARDVFQPVEIGLTDNVVVFDNLLSTPGWWPIECAVTNAPERKNRGRWEEFPFRRSRQQLQEERDACAFTFAESDMPAGPAPWTLQDPAADGFLRGLEALVAWGEYEVFAPWNSNPHAVNHPDRGARFAAASTLLHQVERKHEIAVPAAMLVVDRNYLGAQPALIQKRTIKRKDVLCLPFQYVLPAQEHALDLPKLDLVSPFPGVLYPQVLMDFANVPSHQVVRMSAREMDAALEKNHDWRRMFHPKENPWELYKARLLDAVQNHPERGPALLEAHPGYSVKLSGMSDLYRA